MKLNRQSKDELRKRIVEQLKDVPEGQRVQLDKELLEDLLFEVVTIDKEKNIKVKLPIWSGEFLKKLDLSQVDFTDVSWCILDAYKGSNYRIEFEDITISDESVRDKINKIRDEGIEERLESSNGFVVGYGGTNANIDLTKSFEALHGGYIEVGKCNFAGVDFSHQYLTGIQSLYFYGSSLSGTRLTIPSEMPLQAFKSFFDGIDLSSRTIDADGYLSDDTYNLSYCSLRNTGININLDTSVKGMHWDKALRNAMNEDWVGCYVNGKKVLSYEERQRNASDKREEYEQMKDGIFDSVLGSIEEQVNHMKR